MVSLETERCLCGEAVPPPGIVGRLASGVLATAPAPYLTSACTEQDLVTSPAMLYALAYAVVQRTCCPR
jgi:hypothetical protein